MAINASGLSFDHDLFTLCVTVGYETFNMLSVPETFYRVLLPHPNSRW